MKTDKHEVCVLGAEGLLIVSNRCGLRYCKVYAIHIGTCQSEHVSDDIWVKGCFSENVLRTRFIQTQKEKSS